MTMAAWVAKDLMSFNACYSDRLTDGTIINLERHADERPRFIMLPVFLSDSRVILYVLDSKSFTEFHDLANNPFSHFY